MAAATDGRCADWPQFRCDAARSAATAEELPATLHLEWVRHLPPPRPAFVGEVRLQYDAAYEPVVLGDTMFVPSMLSDSVAALDTATGAERWRFFADGPVRFAPVAWEGGVYFVSDDGCLYCVEAESGRLRWKHRSPPAKTAGTTPPVGHNDRTLLGNGRLIVPRPARGGPVLLDGIVYYGDGLWSHYGTAVTALDAKSGKPLWSNAESNFLPKANMDHGIAHLAGVAPQGYLAVVGGRLVVPCGMHLPALLDLKTGAVQPYTMGWGGRNGLPKGTWFVAGMDHYLSHSGDLYDIARPNDEQFADTRMKPDYKTMLYPAGVTRVAIDPANQKDLGPFREPVFCDGVMYQSDRGVVAYDLTDGKLQERAKTAVPAERRTDTYPDKWLGEFRVLWQLDSPLKVHIKAGPHLYLGGAGTVAAVRIPQAGQEPQIVWQAKIEGTPQRMLAAGGRLFVSTREGGIYAFGNQQQAEGKKGTVPICRNGPEGASHKWGLSPFSPAPPADAWTKTAADILRTTKKADGYALVLGVGSGRLAEELARQSKCDVIVLERDAAKVDEFRRRLDRAGLYGTRVSVYVGNPLTYPLPPYLASLIVSEKWSDIAAALDRTSLAAILHPLRPYGGTTCMELDAPQRAALKQRLADDKPAGALLKESGRWTLLSRDGPLPGAADWSHAAADAANTGASADAFLKAPLEMLWFDAPPRWDRTPGATVVRVSGGRVLIKAATLQAVDVFTGRRLWEVAVPLLRSAADQMVVLEDALYVTGGKTCLVLDPATGHKKAQFDLPGDFSGPWLNLRVVERRLVAQSGKHVVCVDRSDGRLLWKSECARPNLSIAVGGGKVFCAELPVKPPAKPAGKTPDTKLPEAATRALDLESGKILWEITGGSEVQYCAALDLVVMSSGVYRAADGAVQAAFPPPPEPKGKGEIPRPWFVVGQNALVGTTESVTPFDLLTGKPAGETTNWVRRGCTTPRASANLVTTRFRGNAACVDLATRQITSLWNVRAACSNNLFPANGVLNVPNLMGGCTCNYLPISQACVPASVVVRPEGRPQGALFRASPQARPCQGASS
jgi:outer membrane protein assembly factor BamB